MSQNGNDRRTLLKRVFHQMKKEEGLTRAEFDKIKHERLSPTQTVDTYISGRLEAGDIIWSDNYTRLKEVKN